MEYILYSGLGLVVGIVMLFVKVGNLKDRLEKLEKLVSGQGRSIEKTVSKEKSISVQQSAVHYEDSPRYVVGNESVSGGVNSDREEKNHEYNIGSKIIPAIGIISVLFGMGFFLKYTFDHNLIDETGRVILGFVIGVLFVAVGERLRTRFAGYSALLMGGGFAILYLAAKFGLIYNLYPDSMGFILMSVVTAAAVIIANKTNSRIIAFTALLGGFLNPFLAFEGQANEVVLFNYILLLLVGMLFLA